MKNILRVITLLFAGVQLLTGQNDVITPNHPNYDQLKAAGQLPQNVPGGIYKSKEGKLTPVPISPSQKNDLIRYDFSERTADRSETCNCFQEVDTTFRIAEFTIGTPPEFRNDDGSTDEIQLPFDYCLYGDSYNSCFINNNGNISFNQQVGTFSSAAFPNNFVMVAPFWADVDTQGPGSGLVYYKITEHYMVVIWDRVGYYSSQTDKKNSFQLIISDGTAPIVPFGNNTAFCYGDMQWTTGSASQGVGGFGGIPATSGSNRGNSQDYIQFGQFGQAGGVYQGPFGTNSGIDWLDNRSFFFSSCTEGISDNVPPILISSTICETAYICVGNQASFELSFFAVEEGQNCTIAISPTEAELPGLTIVSNTTGNISTITGYIDALPQNIGSHDLTFTVTDDGVPAGVTELILTVVVVDNNFTPVIAALPDSICDGNCAILSVGEFDTYLWSTGETTPTIQSCSTTEVYTCAVTIGTCAGTSDPYSVPSVSINPPVISGDSILCGNIQGSIGAQPGYSSYSWDNGQFGDTITVGPGTYILTVSNNGGCVARDTFTVINSDPQPVIEGDTHTCFDELAQIGLTETYESYTWSNTSTQPINFVNQGTFTVTVIDSNGCSGVSAPYTVTNSQPDAQFTGIVPFCEGDSILLIGSGTYASYLWYTTPNGSTASDTLSSIDSLLYDGGLLTLEVTDNFGCKDTINSNIESTLPPVASFTREPSQNTIFVNVPIQFTDTSVPATTDPIDTWDWNFTPPSQDFTDQNPLIAFPDTGVQYITLIVTSELGCIDTTTSFVYIVDDPFVPNAISPDGDGINDFLKIPFLSGFPGNKVVIYNRWGKKVFEGDDYKNDWNGDDLPAGTYFYVVNAPNMKSELKGSVTILRN